MELTYWYEDAACAGVDPQIFEGAQNTALRFRWKRAEAICATCPVQIQCLADAMRPEVTRDRWQHGRRFSMYQAGLTPDDLTKLYNQGSRKAS